MSLLNLKVMIIMLLALKNQTKNALGKFLMV